MIQIKQADYEAILAHARAQVPEEACGLIAGTVTEAGVKIVEKVYLLENADHSPEHFSLSPAQQLQAIKDMRAHGWRPLGNWHSHPETPSRPSQEDKRLAYDSAASYLILSLMDPAQPVLRAFHIAGSSASEEPIQYV